MIQVLLLLSIRGVSTEMSLMGVLDFHRLIGVNPGL